MLINLHIYCYRIHKPFRHVSLPEYLLTLPLNLPIVEVTCFP